MKVRIDGKIIDADVVITKSDGTVIIKHTVNGKKEKIITDSKVRNIEIMLEK